MKPADIIDAYQELVGRALDVLRWEPYSMSIDAEIFDLKVDGPDACLSWTETDYDYDTGNRSADYRGTFPAALLTMDEATFVTWRRGHQLEREAREAAAKDRCRRSAKRLKAAAKARREKEERETFERLKAKYEPAIDGDPKP